MSKLTFVAFRQMDNHQTRMFYASTQFIPQFFTLIITRAALCQYKQTAMNSRAGFLWISRKLLGYLHPSLACISRPTYHSRRLETLDRIPIQASRAKHDVTHTMSRNNLDVFGVGWQVGCRDRRSLSNFRLSYSILAQKPGGDGSACRLA